MLGTVDLSPITMPDDFGQRIRKPNPRYADCVTDSLELDAVVQEQGQLPPTRPGTPISSQETRNSDSESTQNLGNSDNDSVTEDEQRTSDGIAENNTRNSDTGNSQEQSQPETVAALPHHTLQPSDAGLDVFDEDYVEQLIASAHNTLESAKQDNSYVVNPYTNAMQITMDTVLKAVKGLGDQVKVLAVLAKENEECIIDNTKACNQAFNSLFGVLDDNKINEIRTSTDIEANLIIKNGINYQKDMKYKAGQGSTAGTRTKRNENQTLNSDTLLTNRNFPGLPQSAAATATAAAATPPTTVP